MQHKRIAMDEQAGPVTLAVADSFFPRFLGLMGRKPSPSGLLLIPCNSVHTCFMRYDLDIFFLDREYRIVAIRRDMKPWRMTAIYSRAHMAMEIPSQLGLFRSLEIGSVLTFAP